MLERQRKKKEKKEVGKKERGILTVQARAKKNKRRKSRYIERDYSASRKIFPCTSYKLLQRSLC